MITKKPISEFILDDNTFILPVGYKDSEGIVHKTVTLRPMMGEVEEAMADPKVKNNGGKIITELCFGIITEIGSLKKVTKDIVRNLSIADRDFIVLANAIVSFDFLEKPLEFEALCPTPNEVCGKKITLIHDLNKLEIGMIEEGEDFTTEYEFQLKDGVYYDNKLHKEIVVTLLNGRVQEATSPILQRNLAEGETSAFQMITKRIGDIPILRPDMFKKNMTKRDRDRINKELNNLGIGVDFKVSAICPECGFEFETRIPTEALMGE